MFYKCINGLKLATIYNKKGFIISKNKINMNLLKELLKIRIIKFVKIENNTIKVYINYINNKPIFNNITNLYKPSQKMHISLKNLKKVSFKYNWIIILSTSQGIMNNFEAINKNLGGVIIAKIWN